MRAAKNIFANIDKVSILLYAMLILFGWVNIYASQYNEDTRMIFDFSTRYGKQLLFIGISSFVAFLILIIDWKFFYSLSYLFYIAVILLLIGVLFKETTGGAASWFELGNFKFQPSEFAKFTTALALAKYYNSLHLKSISILDKLKTYAIIILPFLLIILQNDLGTALVYAAFILVLYREGLADTIIMIVIIIFILFFLTLVTKKIILISVLATIALVVYLLSRRKTKTLLLILGILISCTAFIFSVEYIFNDVLAPHQKERINILLKKSPPDPYGASYNVIQSKIAIGSGGFDGKGFLNGTQTRFDFVPEQSTDFIFCTIGEEWGFIGSFFFMILFVGLLLRILFLAERQRSNFSRVYGYSVATILFMHFVINIGMTIGLLPVIGIPLPFISYGGSSLLGFTILLFIFLNLDSYRLQILR